MIVKKYRREDNIMLAKFEVKNFKNFKNQLIFDFTNTKNYKFNQDAIDNGIVKTSLIYGHNGVGKSNLGFAIFDIISHLTDKNFNSDKYDYYLSADSEEKYAIFVYEFKFDKDLVRYKYIKSDFQTIILEELYINSKLYAFVDKRESTIAQINAIGADTLKRDIGNSNISILTYILTNAILNEEDKQNIAFKKMMNFVNNMLFFRSLERNRYLGFEQGVSSIDEDIISKNNVKDFEKFLNEMGVNCKLDILEIDLLDTKELVFDFGKKKVPFFSIASSGTRSLALFYYWFQRLKEDKIKFVYIDEFDAFYHFQLSAKIINKLKELDIQTVVTTHNTSLITNSILRPDCYFLLNNNTIKSLADRTDKELREAHNIEKMYKAGSFGF